MLSEDCVLLDFDLHKPKVHKRFGIANTAGTSSYLIGQSDFQSVIHRNVIENLDVITGGPIPPNASEIILSSHTHDLITEAQKNYEYVIVDTPPLLLISDSQVLVSYSDMALFVLNSKKAHRDGVRYLEEFIAKLDNKNVGLILNNIRLKRWKYYYGKVTGSYGYGDGYVYQYGSYNKEK